MKSIFWCMIFFSVSAAAQAPCEFLVDGKCVSQLDAARALLNDKSKVVLKACEAELTPRLQIHCKKEKKTSKIAQVSP